MAIKAVLFDFGNVISLVQDGSCQREMEALTGVPAEVFRSVFEKYRIPFDKGDLTGAQMYSALLHDAGYEELSCNGALCAEIARIDLESWRTINDEVTKWALSLQKRGFKLGILSNMPFEFLDLYEKEIVVFTHADVAVFSCREHVIKPDKKIYDIALERLSVASHEVVFFDDMPVNIEAARSFGIHGFLWTDLTQAQADFDALCGYENVVS